MAKPLIENPSAHTEYMRRWRAKNAEANAAYQRAYHVKYLSDPENLENGRERARSWGRDNPERNRQRARDWFHHNRDQAIENIESWRRNNPNKVREIGRRSTSTRRARIAGLSTDIPVDYEAVAVRSAGTCGICGKPLSGRVEFDHIIPIARGGLHVTENLQLAHSRCNRRKSANLK
jgi:5-methylcytosine-specific restriction endonuclease McrA